MAKAVLVMDMPIPVCQKCTLCHETPNDGYMCCATGKILPDGEKPDWCPLRELPEKKETNYYMNNKEKGIVDGWNVCLEKITGE